MIYRNKNGKDFILKIAIGDALEVFKTWNINLLEVNISEVDYEKALRIAYTLSGYNPEILEAVNKEALLESVRAEIIFFYFPPDYERDSSAATEGEEKLSFKKLFELAGLAGVSPLPFTLWQLVATVKGAQMRDWSTASAVLSMLYNANRGKGKPKGPAEFNPTIKKAEAKKDLPCIDSILSKDSGFFKKG